MTKIFIDGSSGTTGLRIRERLAGRRDLELIEISESARKDDSARAERLNEADVVFLCLPDAAAIEAVSMIRDEHVVVIDTSTAHRVDDLWTYGMPELPGQRERIRRAKRIANPGCHASGFIALVAPLVRDGILPRDIALTCTSLTGYSGGGKKMIAEYEGPDAGRLLAPRMYGLSQSHKHLPEMKKMCGLDRAPIFCPVVSSYFSGMLVSVPIFVDEINGGIDEIKRSYREHYDGRVIRCSHETDPDGSMSAASMAGRDYMEVGVFGNGERAVLVSRFDNLGKGASGAAIQNMNIALGLDETEGLDIMEER